MRRVKVEGDLYHGRTPEGALAESAAEGDADGPVTLAEKFEKFDRENPAVYAAFVRLADEWARRTGGRKIGIGALAERVRWELALQTNDPDYKINNNFRAFYVRKLIKEHPRFAPLFELRRSVADEWVKAA